MSGGSSHNSLETLSGRIYNFTGVSVSRCYQCGKCSAGCPLAVEMDYPPSLMLRMLQMDMPHLDNKAISSKTTWLCLTCETCYARCPQEVDIPKMMDYIRSESVAKNKINPEVKDIYTFHAEFLKSVKNTGRLFEVGLVAGYKMKSGHLLKDVLIAPKMFLSGKLSLFAHRIKDKASFSKIFSGIVRKGGAQ